VDDASSNRERDEADDEHAGAELRADGSLREERTSTERQCEENRDEVVAEESPSEKGRQDRRCDQAGNERATVWIWPLGTGVCEGERAHRGNEDGAHLQKLKHPIAERHRVVQ